MKRMMKAAAAASRTRKGKALQEKSKGVSDLLKDQVQVRCRYLTFHLL